MGFFVRLIGFQPPVRDDGVKWTGADIEESPPGSDAWALIDPKVLADYPDPAEPPVLNFTTTEAQLEAAWYRVVWRDAAGTRAPTEAVGASGAGLMLPPSAPAIRDRSPLLKKTFPANPLDGDVEAALREAVADAASLVEQLTCRRLDGSLPEELHRVAVRAVTLKAEQIAVASDAKLVERTAGGRRLRSISAGPWSESYFAPGELGMKGGRPRMDSNDAIDEALWALATEDCRAQFIAEATGKQPPAGAVTEFDYRRRGSITVRGGLGPDGY